MAFLAGQTLTAKMLNDAFGERKEHLPLDSGTVNSVGYTTTRTGATVNPVGVAFVAPSSGKVTVHWHVSMRNTDTTVNGFCLAAPQIRQGATIDSGTLVHTVNDGVATQRPSQATASKDEHFAGSHPFTLTAGADYNVVLAFRVGAGTGTFSRASVWVTPDS